MADARQVAPGARSARETLEKVGWGLLLIWTGAALLLHFGWGVGLAGAGAIVLAMQAVRRYAGLHRDPFGIFVGVLLLACGVWLAFDVSVQLVPVLCIVAGVVLLASSWARRRQGEHAELHATSHPRA